ncbi:DivIVA domain-containing protein [Specibacter cremeus]|uniref:DivIVA domain-containing protein n=1 Tax=Specibacter cremeus TaxID=1629051 RepID=UPI000F796B46|nr:DivIVA domain-containing protein [Specibacter cremeus]
MYFLVFVALLVAGGVALYVVGLRRPDPDAALLRDGLADPVANLPPVLLPADPVPADVDRLRFALGLRGYRMDQVDEVLDTLRDQLAERDRQITELQARLASGSEAPGGVERGPA